MMLIVSAQLVTLPVPCLEPLPCPGSQGPGELALHHLLCKGCPWGPRDLSVDFSPPNHSTLIGKACVMASWIKFTTVQHLL